MNNMNVVVLEGNLTQDPELRFTNGGAAICTFSLAVNRQYKKKEEKVEEVSFIDITVWNRSAEVCAEFLKKGRKVIVQGTLRQDRWEDKDGKKRSKLFVTAVQVNFIGSRAEAKSA